MPYTDQGRNRALRKLRQDITHVGLHFAEPGVDANEIPTVVRKAITWNEPSGGQLFSSNRPSLRVQAGQTVTHVGFWSALTGGTLLAWADVADVAYETDRGYIVSSVTFDIGGGPIFLPPSTPTNLTATALSASSIHVTWSTSANATGYELQRRRVNDTGDEDWPPIATTSSTSFTDTGLTEQTTYYYRVVALNTAGFSAPSVTDSATTLAGQLDAPLAPTNFSAAALGPNSIRTSWTASDGAESYRVQRLTFVEQPTDTTAPTVPANLAATAQSATQINLSWSPSTDSESGVSGYRLYRRIGTLGGGALLTTKSGVNNTSHSDSGLTADTDYTYEVEAFDVAGNVSSRSAPVTARTLVGTAPPPPIPATPTGLAGSALSTSVIRLTWNASTDATGYRLFRGTTQIANITATTFDDTGRTAATSYSYSVEAFNTSGTSARSASITVTTLSDTGQAIWIASAGDLMNAGTTPGNASGTQRLNVYNKFKQFIDAGECQRVLLNGDLIYDWSTTSGDQYSTSNAVTGAFNKTYGNHRPILQPTPGNHENSLSSYYNYFAYLATQATTVSSSGTAGQYQAIDVGGGWVVISINFYLAQSSLVSGGSHYNWVNNVLQNNTSKRFIYMFHPPKYANCIDKVEDQNIFNSKLNDLWNLGMTAKVDLSMTGHSHSYFRNDRINASNAQSTTGIYHVCNGMGGDNKDANPGSCSGTGYSPSSWPGVKKFDQHFGVSKIRLQGPNVSGQQISAEDNSIRDSWSFTSRK